jgi:hypothetical protein
LSRDIDIPAGVHGKTGHRIYSAATEVCRIENCSCRAVELNNGNVARRGIERSRPRGDGKSRGIGGRGNARNVDVAAGIQRDAGHTAQSVEVGGKEQSLAGGVELREEPNLIVLRVSGLNNARSYRKICCAGETSYFRLHTKYPTFTTGC